MPVLARCSHQKAPKRARFKSVLTIASKLLQTAQRAYCNIYLFKSQILRFILEQAETSSMWSGNYFNSNLVDLNFLCESWQTDVLNMHEMRKIHLWFRQKAWLVRVYLFYLDMNQPYTVIIYLAAQPILVALYNIARTANLNTVEKRSSDLDSEIFLNCRST